MIIRLESRNQVVCFGRVKEVSISCRSRTACGRSCLKSKVDLSSIACAAVDGVFPRLVVQGGSGGLGCRIVGVCVGPVAGSATRCIVVIELNPYNVECGRKNHVAHVGILEAILRQQWALRSTGNDVFLCWVLLEIFSESVNASNITSLCI